MEVVIRAQLAPDYDGMQRILLDLERFGCRLAGLRLDPSAGVCGAKRLMLRIILRPGLDPAQLGTRLARHGSVRSVSVTAAPRPRRDTGTGGIAGRADAPNRSPS